MSGSGKVAAFLAVLNAALLPMTHSWWNVLGLMCFVYIVLCDIPSPVSARDEADK